MEKKKQYGWMSISWFDEDGEMQSYHARFVSNFRTKISFQDENLDHHVLKVKDLIQISVETKKETIQNLNFLLDKRLKQIINR